jgi:hypothetical protein
MKTARLEPAYIYYESRPRQTTDKLSSYICIVWGTEQKKNVFLGNIVDHLFLRMKAGGKCSIHELKLQKLQRVEVHPTSALWGRKQKRERSPVSRALVWPLVAMTGVSWHACSSWPANVPVLWYFACSYRLSTGNAN